jgi:uncharacterized SAM-binding protein YcdF (DUF218 family)
MTFLSVPSTLLGLIATAGLVLLMLRLRIGAIVAASGLAAFAVAVLSPLGNALLTPLDQRFPMWSYPPQQDLEGIIVQCGSYDKVRFSYLSTLVLENDTEPLAMLVDLPRRYPEAKIILTGGNGSSKLDDAATLKKYLVSLGMAPERLSAEEQSRTTAESAQFAANLLHPSPSSRWLLVAYGYRMPRTVGAFRSAGFNVLAFPVHLRTDGWENMWRPDGSGSENLLKLDIATHEWLALVYYKLRGYSDEWFAGPEASSSPSKHREVMTSGPVVK